tara:strand:- start:784 stop:1644 length:861 start_codon:yes stop_codon:yes gene_type:complete
MKNIILGLFCCIALNGFAQTIDTNVVDFEGNRFFHLSHDSNRKLLIFLHGGVSNPYFKQAKEKIELRFLVENNKDLVTHALIDGYDLLVPVSNSNLDWISNPEFCFKAFDKYLSQSPKKYKEIVLSGFSDGGTGSFKIFYQHPGYFSGLIVFNGYPYYKNFADSVDYSAVTNKKVLFIGTKFDKTTPYEFMLTEYCKQKAFNPDTYIYVTNGGHEFHDYDGAEIKIIFSMLDTKPDNTETIVVHGYIRNDSLVKFYEFRKEIVRKYGFGDGFYKVNKVQKDLLKAN